MTTPKAEVETLHHEEARRDLRRLTDGNCLESIQARVPRFHLFNELLVQDPAPGGTGPVRSSLHDGESKLEGSYDVALQPAAPFRVME